LNAASDTLQGRSFQVVTDSLGRLRGFSILVGGAIPGPTT
jgi:hypothetical protein